MRLVNAAFVQNVRELTDGQILSDVIPQPVVFPRHAHGHLIGIPRVWFVLYLEDGLPGPFNILVTVTNPSGHSVKLGTRYDFEWPAKRTEYTVPIYFDTLRLDNFEKNGYYVFKFLASGGDVIGELPIAFRIAD